MHSTEHEPDLIVSVFFDSNKQDWPSTFIHELNLYNPDDPADINLRGLVEGMKNWNYFYYQGSLTTPPCTEGIDWIIMQDVQHCSKSQVAFMNSMWEKNETNGELTNDRALNPSRGNPVYFVNRINDSGYHLIVSAVLAFSLLLVV